MSACCPRIRAWLAWVALGCPLAVLAGVPKHCQPDQEQTARLAQAQQVFQPADPAEAVQVWDALLRDSADGPSCRTVEIVWRIGEFLKVQKQSPELALRYLNQGVAAYVKGPPAEDWSLGKVLKTTGHFFRRQGDAAHACRSLAASWRVFGTLDGSAAVREQLRAEMALVNCPIPPTPAPSPGP